MVDWAGGDGRRSGGESCIWIAHGSSDASRPEAESPPSRTEAEDRIAELLAAPGSTLAGFDFGFGYPRGFARHLPPAPPSDLPWRRAWRYLANEVRDDRGSGRFPSNRSNRFEVAARLNALLARRSGPAGPFWCLDRADRLRAIPQRQPPQPFLSRAGGEIAALRLADVVAGADFPFRLFGNGSVGSQMLTGIPRLERLRARVPGCGVWPFDTGWAQGAFPPPGVRAVLAEIYPSLRPPLPDAVRDRGQVRALWRWARDLDRAGLLAFEFARPQCIALGSVDDEAALHEEGWILGVRGK
jgi:hypothetical protein